MKHVNYVDFCKFSNLGWFQDAAPVG
jgi:hypothetical protein